MTGVGSDVTTGVSDVAGVDWLVVDLVAVDGCSGGGRRGTGSDAAIAGASEACCG